MMRVIIAESGTIINWDQVFEIDYEGYIGLRDMCSLHAYGHNIYVENDEIKRISTEIFSGSYAECSIVLKKITEKITSQEASGVLDINELTGNLDFRKRADAHFERLRELDEKIRH